MDGHLFDSQKEAERYWELRQLEKAGEIKNLVLQPRFVLIDSFEHGGKKEGAVFYVADFQYDENGISIVEDVKGFKTPVYKLKRKLFLSRYGKQYFFMES